MNSSLTGAHDITCVLYSLCFIIGKIKYWLIVWLNGASVVDYSICTPTSATDVADLEIHPETLEVQESDRNCKTIKDFII